MSTVIGVPVKEHVEESAFSDREAKLQRVKEAAIPLIKLLNEEFDPHVTAIVTPTSVEVLSSEMAFPNINDFIQD